MCYSTRKVIAGLLLAGLAVATPAAAAGPEPAAVAVRPAIWEIRKFMSVKIVPREAGAPANEHPLALEPEALRLRLSGLTIASGRRLFEKDELALLVGPLCQALAAATPGEDILLLSNYKREGSGWLVSPKAITARLFQQAGRLNLIVHDDRFEFYNKWVQDRDKEPVFEFGSRAHPGSAQLRSPEGSSIRPDWVVLPMASAAAVPVAASAVTAVMPAAPAPPVRDEAFFEQQQQRLRGLQRMRDANLMTEVEYQEKRKEILAGL